MTYHGKTASTAITKSVMDRVIWSMVARHIQSTAVCLPVCTPGSIDLSQPGGQLLLIVYHHILFLQCSVY